MNEFEVYHPKDMSDPFDRWEKRQGDMIGYLEQTYGIVLFHPLNGAICRVKNNLDIGFALDTIMRGLRLKKIRPTKINILPIDYYHLDYIDPLASSAYVIARTRAPRRKKLPNPETTPSRSRSPGA